MQDVWFTSDTHFGHRKIFDFCPTTRKGNSIEEMNELMIRAWNNRVKKGDHVYHTGDFSFAGRAKTIDILQRLNGEIHLVMGNHDKALNTPEIRAYFASWDDYKVIKVGDQRIVMMHFPIESWDMMKHGTIMLHGHLHGDQHHECRIIKNRMDIGIDTRKECDMAPYHFDEIVQILKERGQ